MKMNPWYFGLIQRYLPTMKRTSVYLFIAIIAFGCSFGAEQSAQAQQAQEALQPGDWPQFRGPGGLGVSEAKSLPVTWSAQKNIVWKTPLPGPGSSSPIVVGDCIFVICYTGYGVSRQAGQMTTLKRHLLSLKRSDGTILWNKAVEAKQPEHRYEGHVQRHGYATSTPAADGQRVYVFFGKSGVLAFDYGGKQLWQADVGSDIHRYGSGNSPVLYQNLVIVNASVESESLVALDQQSGKEVWRVQGIRNSWNTPLLVEVPGGKTELVVTIHGQVLGFEPTSGKQLWHCTGVDDYMVPSVVAHEGVVYCLLGRAGTVMAIRAGGRGDVSKSHVLWRFDKGRNIASPVHYEGHLYFVREARGIARCLQAKTGLVVYEQRLTPAPDEIYASPLVADGKIYYVSRERGTYVLAAKPQFQLLAHNVLGDPSIFNASPVAIGGRLLLRSERYLYCIGEK